MKKLFFLLLYLSAVIPLNAQVSPNVHQFDSLTHDHTVCGISPDYVKSHALPGYIPKVLPNDFPAYAIVDCGKFRLYYEDLIPASPQVGFADPVLGAARRNTLCAVLTYVQTVFDFSNVPDNNPIRLQIDVSFVAGANPIPPGSQFLARATPVTNTALSEIVNGFIFDYAHTGIDPSPANNYHSIIQVNFDHTDNAFGNPQTIIYQDDFTQPFVNCLNDLFTVLLHEVGHAMGFFSMAADNLGVLTVPINGQYTGLDFMIHRSSALNSTAGMQKLIQGTIADPFMNPGLIGVSASDNRYWSSPNAAPDNHPMYSGVIYDNFPNVFASGSALSHLDEQLVAYTFRQRISPGKVEEYVMGPFGIKGSLRRIFTDAEINIFLNMGYDLNPSYTGAAALVNLPPYSTKMADYTDYPEFDFPETVAPDEVIINNSVPIGILQNTYVYVLSDDATIVDPEGSDITVAPGSLINHRGCGNGGNNHARLTVSPDGGTITYVPRPGFYGRAQYGFKLFDGNEVGSYHVITIDVLPGDLTAVTPGNNLVINSNMEEGSEVARVGADEMIDNATTDFSEFREGLFGRGIHFADAHPYNYIPNLWVPFSSGDIIRQSYINCSDGVNRTEMVGREGLSFPWSTIPAPLYENPSVSADGSQRYRIMCGPFNYFNLGDNVESCKRYVLSFDYATRADISTSVTTTQVDFGFVNATSNWPTPPTPIPAGNSGTLPLFPTMEWRHAEIPFTYCGGDATILQLSQMVIWQGFMMDNVQLVEVTTPPPPLTVNISNSVPSMCIGGSSVIHATVLNPLCNVTYLWSNGSTSSTIVVAPPVTTTYTVTVSDGCTTATNSTTVTVGAVPPTMAFMGNVIACEGQTIGASNFSSIPVGASFAWTNSNTNIGLAASGSGNIPAFTAQNPFNTPVVSTITVTPAFGTCTGTAGTFTITVNPQPAMIQPANIVVCSGTVIPASAFTSIPVGASFAWSNNNTSIGLGTGGTGNVPAFTAINTTGSPIVSTITVVPVSGAHCQGIPVTYTITVNSATVLAITPSNTTIAPGGSVVLTVTGASGTSYAWTPAAGLSCITCANPTASPAVTTTYMVTGLHGDECPGTAYATVSIAGPPCTNCPYTLAPAGTLTSNPTTNRVYCVNNSVLVTGNVTIANCELKMAANTQIVVTPGSTLSLLGCHLYSCGAMWQGIQVLPGGKVVTNDQIMTIWPSITTKSTLIEDAIVAIEVNPYSNVTADLLIISNTTFNRNATGIRVSSYMQPLATYPFNISKSVFTCRNIPFVVNSNAWPQTPAVAGSNPGANPLASQVINNTTYSQTGTAAFLKAPYAANIKSQRGIHLQDVGATTGAATTAPTYYEFSLGNPIYVNIFDNLSTCVELVNSNFKSVNNIYQNTGQKGIGINAKSIGANTNRLQVVSVLATVGSNKFVDCGTAIWTENYFEHNLQYSDVRSTQVNGNGSTTKRGFIMRSNRYRVCNVLFNSIYNVADGISFEAINGPYNITGVPYASGQYAGKVNVDYNTIRPHLSGSGVTSQYVNNAVYLVNSGAHTERANNLAPTISTNMNTIIANRPVYYANWIRENCQIQNNTITVLLNPYFISFAEYYGIKVVNSQWSSINGSFIKSNTVGGFYTPAANSNPSSDPVLTGIVGSSIVGFSVTCNNTFNTTRGIGFTGANPNTVFKNNKMQSHRYGFFLDQNGSIGLQGTSSAPSDNQWTGIWLASNYKTAVLGNSTAQNSKLYVRNATGYNPNGSTISIPQIFATEYSNPSTLLYSPLAAPIFDLSCIQFIPFPGIKKNLELIVGDSIEYSNDMNELGEKMRYMNKNLVYLALKLDSVLTDSSNVLQDFYNNSLLTAREKIYKIQKNMSSGDLLEATLSNLIFNPENNIEENYKKYHEIYIKYQQGNCGVGDSTDLRVIAEKCPFNDGSVVYQARALYNLIFDTREAFPDLCPEDVRAKSMMIANETTPHRDEILLYPNPAKDEVFIALDQPELLKIEIMVIDANGKIVFENSVLDVRDGLATFTLAVDNGIYFVNVINPITNESSVEKLVIHK